LGGETESTSAKKLPLSWPEWGLGSIFALHWKIGMPSFPMQRTSFLSSASGRLTLALALLFLAVLQPTRAQGLLKPKADFTRADSLRGSLRPERTGYDVQFYHLSLRVNPLDSSIRGNNRIVFRATGELSRLQLDLFRNLDIERIEDVQGREQRFERIEDAVFVDLSQALREGDTGELKVFYGGVPTVARNAPWDGGFTWARDKSGKPWVGVSCQGIGASLWWPNKDHPSDEPDSVLVSVEVPEGLVFAGNGRLRSQRPSEPGWTLYEWFVSYPINNYGISLNIADYVHFSDTFASRSGALSLDYYVLRYNLEKAREHFEQVGPMMACFEQYFAPYPFIRDGFKLIETPYLGMEHQSGIAYGNRYLDGYFGMDYSRINLDFDYIIIHETGHEWWGNSVSCSDNADLWVHEGFCTYSEALYVECLHGYETGLRYVNAKKPEIDNDAPLIGPYGVNKEGSGDMYSKGMLILNTLRHLAEDRHGSQDPWFAALRGLTEDYAYQVVSSADVEQYLARRLDLDLQAFWDQYLRQAEPPVLEYRVRAMEDGSDELEYRWRCEVAGFSMPIRYRIGEGEWVALQPTTQWQTLALDKGSAKKLTWDEERYYYLLERSNR
jgi:aminopeptidase N